MVVRQERQSPAVLIGGDALLRAVQQIRGEHLLHHSAPVVDEDAAGARGSAGAQANLIAIHRLKLGRRFRRGHQRFQLDHRHAFRQLAGLACDQRLSAGLRQQVVGHFVAERCIHQHGVVTGLNHAPKGGKPFLAGFHGNGDVCARFRADSRADRSRVVAGDARVIVKGIALFFAILQPHGGFGIAVSADDFI